VLFTIFTPTFNRMDLLERAYQSIRRQDHTGFEWLIVDDGSTDDTEALVQGWIENGNDIFDIRYIKKRNGGKHTAVNAGVREARGEFFVILDSDDFFVEGAFDILLYNLNDLESTDLGGLLFLNKYSNGNIIGTPFPQNGMVSDFPALYYRQAIRGDKSVVFRTCCLKEFPFPEPREIRLISESVVWHPVSVKYKLKCINAVLVEVEYQQTGLSNSFYKKWFLEGLAFTNFYLIQHNIHPWKDYPRIRSGEYIHLIINSLLINKSYFSQLQGLMNKCLYILHYPRAYYSYQNLKKYVKANNQ